MKNKFLFTLAISIATLSAFAQQQSTTHTSEDSAAINALVMYPDTIRMEIFEACEYPGAIVNIASLQKNSSTDFANLVGNYSKSEQEDLWNLGRYPDLISKLVQGGEKSKEQIDAILTSYPEDIHKTAMKYGKNHYDVLQKMDDLQAKTNAQFAQIISEYPPSTQDVFRDLINHPEIINLLNDHLSLTVRVGDHFRRDPKRVLHRADSMNVAETKQNAEDAEAWKQTIQQNPDEANDLKNSAHDYAKENGYSDEELTTRPDPNYVNNYTCPPYSYWYGYPSWYPYSYWYPYPYWFDCGFYYDVYGNMIMLGCPSFYFTNWYFYYPEHWHHYPHLCNSYINHYYGPRGSHGEHSYVVHNWVRDNKNYLPKDFIANKQNRADAIKQVGQLHIDAQKGNGVKPVSSTVRDQYFQNHATKYPSLNTAYKAEPNSAVKQNIQENRQEPVKQPSVRITNPQQQPVQTPRQSQTPRSNNFNNVNKAQEYHRNTWEQAQPNVRPQQQYQQQAPRPQQQQSAPRPQQSAPAPRQASPSGVHR